MKANKIWRWKQHLLTTSQQYPHAYQKTFRTFKGQMNSSNPWKTVIKIRVYIGSLWVFIYKPMFLEVRGQLTSYPFSAPLSEHFIPNTSANLMQCMDWIIFFLCESYFLQLYSSLPQSEIPTPWVGSGSFTFKCTIGKHPLHFSQRPWWPILVSYKITSCLYISKAQCFPKLFQNVYFIW